MSFHASLKAIGSETVRVTREEAGSYANGYFTPGRTQTFEILASVQTVGGHQLMHLPEADRTKETIKVYTETELFTVQETAHKRADRVEWRGRMFEVQKVDVWDKVMPHFKATCVRIEDDAQ